MTKNQQNILSLLRDLLDLARTKNIEENKKTGLVGENFMVHNLRILGESLVEEFDKNKDLSKELK